MNTSQRMKLRTSARMLATFLFALSAASISDAAGPPARKAGVNIPAQVTPLTVLQLNTKLPYSYCFDYKANPDPGRRYWKRTSEKTWSETYPSGIKSTFKVLGHATVNGIEGTIVVKVSGTESLTGTDNQGGLQAFIPDKGSALMHHFYRNTGRGDTKWHDLGPMLNVQ